MGKLIRHVHNRDLAIESIVSALCKLALVKSTPPGAVDSLVKRLISSGFTFNDRSLLTSRVKVHIVNIRKHVLYSLSLVYNCIRL